MMQVSAGICGDCDGVREVQDADRQSDKDCRRALAQVRIIASGRERSTPIPVSQTNMNVAKSILAAWRNDRIELNPPASAHELAQLAELLGAAVPADLLYFYSMANGMVDNTMDTWHVSLWSIDRVLRENDVVDRAGRRWIAFADVLAYSWCFRFAPGEMQTRVLAESTGEEFASLEAFFGRYSTKPESLDLVKAG
jgi:hypothetical protein